MVKPKVIPDEAWQIIFATAIPFRYFLNAMKSVGHTIDEKQHRDLVSYADDLRCLAAKLSDRECKRHEQPASHPDS